MSAALPESNVGDDETRRELRADRELIWGGLAALIATRFYIAFFFQPHMSDVVLYYNTAVSVVDLHKSIYREVELGYPPAAYWMMVFPRLLDPHPVTPNNQKNDYPRYYRTFRVQMLVLDALACFWFLATVRRRRPRLLAAALWAWTLVSLVLAYTLYDRTDMGVWFCVALWGYAWSRRRDDGSFDAWTALAVGAIGFGVAIKLVTAVMAPFVLLGVWQSRRRMLDLVLGASVFALTAGLPFAIHYPAAGPKVFYFLERHGGRSIQIESVYATAMMLLRPFDPDMKPFYEVSAWHLESRFTPLFRNLATLCLFGGGVAAIVWAWLARDRFDDRRTYCTAGLALAGLLCVAHVLSPQYFIWGLGVLLLVGTEMNVRPYLGLAATALVIAGLTTYVFPYHLDEWYIYDGQPLTQPYNLVRAFHWLPCAALIARNALYVGLVIWTAVRLLRPPFSAPRARGL